MESLLQQPGERLSVLQSPSIGDGIAEYPELVASRSILLRGAGGPKAVGAVCRVEPVRSRQSDSEAPWNQAIAKGRVRPEEAPTKFHRNYGRAHLMRLEPQEAEREFGCNGR